MNPPERPSFPPSSVQAHGGGPEIERLQAALPQLEMLDVIGRGGMGVVYRARHRSLNRLVAVKVLPPELQEADATFAGRFKNEAQAMARLSHPSIVAVFDSGETPDGQLYFVMEHVDGTDLSEVLRERTKLPLDMAVSIAIEICEALSYAHENGVVHRDIKPSNVLLTRKNHVKVADFGLAKMDDLSAGGELTRTGLTRTGTTMGTPEFVAPEALIMGVHVDGRADIYAVGVMLYQMLMGSIPRGLFLMPGLSSKGEIDERIDRIISKAMQSDRARRYQTAAELGADLETLRSEPPPPVSPSHITGTHPISVHTHKIYTSKKSTVFAALVIIVAMLALGGAAFHFGSKPVNSVNASSAPEAPIVWTDGLAEWWRLPKGGSEGVLVREAGGSRVSDRKAVFMRSLMPDDTFTDVAFRVTVSDTSEYTSLYFRMSGAFDTVKNYQAVFWHLGNVKIALNGTQKGGKEIGRFPVPRGYVPGGTHTYEVRARGDTFTVFVDGREAGTARDATLSSGKIYFTGDKGALLQKLEYSDLSGRK